MSWTAVGAVFGGVVVILLLHLLVSPGRTSAGVRSSESAGRDDDRYWMGGILYNNPDDPALFVPKRAGMGRTVNIGHPEGKLILFGPLALPVLLAILKALSSR